MVTTFNVWGLPSWVNGASSDRYRKIASELTQLGSDVVLLQEVWTHRSFTELSDQTRDSAHIWSAASARHKGSFFGQNGLLTLSRYPIVAADVRHFSVANLPDSLMHKGALKITITVGSGQRVNIWNVHLQDGGSTRVRSRQVTELIAWINDAHDGQIADIVGGDFNFTPGSGEFRHFVAAIGPDVHQLAGDAAFPTWDPLKLVPGSGEALDHIFVRMREPADEIHAMPRRVFAASRREDRLSDHMGMEALLTFGSIPEHREPVLLGRRTEFPAAEFGGVRSSSGAASASSSMAVRYSEPFPVWEIAAPVDGRTPLN
jgi:endonuclease/exonuclease/phosphatase family metal-dependent hydrolase